MTAITSAGTSSRVRMPDKVRGGLTVLHGNGKLSPAVRLAQTWGCSGRIARERMDKCFRDLLGGVRLCGIQQGLERGGDALPRGERGIERGHPHRQPVALLVRHEHRHHIGRVREAAVHPLAGHPDAHAPDGG